MRASAKIGLLAACGLALAGCEQTNRMPLPAQGAAVGAGVGALAGALLGGNNRGTGMLIGGLAGAAIGGLAGASLQTEQRGFASTEQEMQVRTQEARQASAQLQNEAKAAEAAASRISSEMNPLRRQIASGRALNDQQTQTLRAAQRDRGAAQDALRKGQQQLAQVRDQIGRLKGTGSNTAQLESEARRIEASNASLAESVRRMNTDLGRIEI
jgi:pyruvate/2-oxoglutarate dehydrogenase complex dihydrolipoamide acyltransferase (E2) component